MRAERRQARAQLGISAPRIRPGDLLVESGLSVIRSPGRSLVTALGTVLAAAAFVSTLGLISTLSQQVTAAFDIRRATEVVVTPEAPATDPGWQDRPALDRLTALGGVLTAGPRVITAERPVRRLAGGAATGPGLRIMGADPGAVRVLAPRLLVGRLLNDADEARASRLVLLPRPVAGELGITRTQVAVFIDDQAYTVAGIYDDVVRRPETLHMVIMPFRTVDRLAAARDAERDILIETAPGAAQLIGRQAPLALAPAAPTALRSIAPPDPRLLRREIEGDVTRSSLLISLVTLVIGTVSIGNAATAGIAARRSEIGLRRAVGGRSKHIFLQLIGETTLLGAIGGAAGAVLGLCVTSAVSLVNKWTPMIDIQLALVASAACAAAGLVAGMVPAARAMRVSPVTALQH